MTDFLLYYALGGAFNAMLCNFLICIIEKNTKTTPFFNVVTFLLWPVFIVIYIFDIVRSIFYET